MPFYARRGSIPPKRHTQHRSAEGQLYYEEHVSREGFSDVYSNIYHLHPPTRVKEVGEFEEITLQESRDKTHRHRHLLTFNFAPSGDWVSGRKVLFFNHDVRLATVSPQIKTVPFFYRNGYADEIIFVHQGKGILESSFGNLSFQEGDYIVIPTGVLYRLNLKEEASRLLVIESRGPVKTPQRYRNKHGQMMEHAPFCERDIRVPDLPNPVDEQGDFLIKVRLDQGIQNYTLAHHPFDLVGWDGYYFPWIFNIKDFMPIVGKVHMPPPVHQTFAGPGYVICSFVPRLFDYHEKSIPAPYAHSNVESAEILYYVEGDFMSRKGVGLGSITFHPAGLPHGPQPGKYEGSIGKTETDEFAVMLDPYQPLKVSELVEQVDDPKYPLSWYE